MALGGSNISAAALDEMPETGAAEFDNEILRALQIEIDTAEELWKTRKGKLQAALDKKFGERAADVRKAEGKDTGTVTLKEQGGLEVKCELRKKVEWSQEELVAVRARIIKGGGDPDAYMQTEYKISEAVFNGWGKPVQDAFMAARTVKPEKPKYVVIDPTKDKGRK